MEEIARVYAEALFEVAKDKGKLDEIHEQLGQVADAIADNRDLQVFLFSPYFSSAEKREGISRVVSGAEPELVNFLELLAEKHRMPAIFRIRRRFDESWAKEKRRLEVKLTSAVELPRDLVEEVGEADREADRPDDRARDRRRRERARGDRAAGWQHGPGRERAQQAGETEKGSRSK